MAVKLITPLLDEHLRFRRVHGTLLPRRADRGAPTGLLSLLNPSPGTGLPPGCDPIPGLPRQDQDHRRSDRAPGHSYLPRWGRSGLTGSAHRASTPPPSDRIRLRQLTPATPSLNALSASRDDCVPTRREGQRDQQGRQKGQIPPVDHRQSPIKQGTSLPSEICPSFPGPARTPLPHPGP